jgi:hypothetical protein
MRLSSVATTRPTEDSGVLGLLNLTSDYLPDMRNNCSNTPGHKSIKARNSLLQQTPCTFLHALSRYFPVEDRSTGVICLKATRSSHDYLTERHPSGLKKKDYGARSVALERLEIHEKFRVSKPRQLNHKDILGRTLSCHQASRRDFNRVRYNFASCLNQMFCLNHDPHVMRFGLQASGQTFGFSRPFPKIQWPLDSPLFLRSLKGAKSSSVASVKPPEVCTKRYF